MARDEGTTGRKRRGPRFRDLTKATQQQRITRAEEAGRLSAEKAAAARQHWGLAPKAEDRQATVWAAQQNLKPWEVRRPRPVPTRQEIDTERQQQIARIQRATGRTRPTFRAPPPPPPARPRDARATSARDYNWALRTPVDAPSRRARRMLAQTMPEERVREIDESRRYVPPPPPGPGFSWGIPSRKELSGLAGVDPRDWVEAVNSYWNRQKSDVPIVTRKAYDTTFSPAEQWEIERTLRQSQETAEAGGRAVGGVLGSRSQTGTQRALTAGFGLDKGIAQDISEIVGNFVRNVSQGAIGVGPGIVMAATHPERTARAVGQWYVENFADPARAGDWNQVAQNLKENPDVLLDVLGLTGAGVSTANRLKVASRAARAAETVETTPARAYARGLVTGKEPVVLESGKRTWGKKLPEPRFHRIGEYVIDEETGKRRLRTKQTPHQRYVSENPQGRLMGDAWDALLNRGGPVTRRLGERRRRKAVAEAREMDRARLFGPIERYREMSREVQADPAQAVAYDRMLTRGGTPAEQVADIDREIQVRVAAGLDESPSQREEIRQLQAAARYLANPSKRFLDVVEQGRTLADRTQNLLVEARLLRPETAEAMLRQPMQFLEGPVTPVVSPMRDQIEATLRSQDWDDALVETTLNYLDTQAHSFARRNDVEPEVFYREIYHSAASVDAEDFMSALNSANEDVWITQTQRGPEFEITEGRAGTHLKAHQALTSDDPEVRAAAVRRAQPKGRMPTGITTIEGKRTRILNEIPDANERAEFARWYSDIGDEFERYFGADAAAAMRSWLASQVATSPAGGMLGLLKAMEYRYLNGRWPEKGFNVNIVAMGKAWDDALGTDPAGVAAKISDFFNSAYGQGTRTWLQHAPGYGPGVVDRWTLRSDGFVDHQAYGYLRSIGVEAPDPKADPSFYDMSAGPNAYQYEWSSLRLNELRDLFNAERIDGRTNWAVEEVQALDWFATRREWGEPGGGWDDTWARNSLDIVGEVTGEAVRDWLREGERGAIVRSVSHNGAHGRVEILGTPSQAEALARKLANESGRTSYTFYTAGKETSGTRRLGIDIVPSEGADSQYIFDSLRLKVGDLENEGLLVLPHGNGGLRIMFADSKGRPLRTLGRKDRDQLLSDLQDLNIDARPIAARMGVFHGARPDRSLYRGVDPRGVFARGAAARRRGTDFRVAEVVGRDGAERFIDGFQRNARAWSLSPRVVEDFTERGYRAFLSDDGLAGAAVGPDGEIVSVFNSGGDKGLGAQAIIEALANGGTWLNAYDGFLPAAYANVGFREVARLRFDDAMAPSNWTYENGRPDIVFMSFAPDRPITRGRRVDTYADPWQAGVNRARRTGERGHNERSIADMLNELADRGDGMPHDTGTGVLTQWKRRVKVTEGDPVVQGAVRVTDDGVDLRITNAANFSTLVHENAHATLRASLEWLAQGEDARLPEMLDVLGLDSIDDLGDVEKTRRAQELWARTVEAAVYLSGENGLISAPHARRLMTGARTEMKQNYKQGVRQIAGEEFGKDTIVDMLQNDAVMSLLRDLHDVTYGTTRRADAVFIPRLAPTAPSKVARVVQRASASVQPGGITPGTSPVAKGRSRNIRFEQGKYLKGPEAVTRYASATARREVRNQIAKEILESQEAKPIGRDANGDWVIEEGYVLFNYDKVPGVGRMLDERLGLQEQRLADASDDLDMEPVEMFEQTKAATDDIFGEGSEVFPNLDSLPDDVLADLIENKRVVQIPKRLQDDYLDAVSGFTVLSRASAAVMRALGPIGAVGGAPIKLFTTLQRWGMVLKPAYITSNTVGSAATATMHNPFWVGEIKKVSDYISDWSSESLAMLDDLGGGGSYEAARVFEEESRLARGGRLERTAFQKTAHAVSVPERRIRRMVVARSLKKAGYATEADFRALVEAARTDPIARARYNQLGRWAEDAAIRFRGMNDAEKAIVRRALFVYAWVRASLRYTARFPINNPVMAAGMNRLGNEAWDDLQEYLEKGIGFRGGLVLGQKTDAEGQRLVKMLDLSSILPFTAGAETARVVSGMATRFLGGETDFETVQGMLSEGVGFALSLATGETEYGQQPSKIFEGLSKSSGFAAIPLVSWVYRFADPSVTEKRTKTFGPQSRADVAGQFLLGQLWPRDTNVDAAHKSWMRRQPKQIAVPLREQEQADTLMDRYEAAVDAEGDFQNEEWSRAVQARAAYSTMKGLAGRDIDELGRARAKAQALKKFYPEVYNDLYIELAGSTVDEGVNAINREYQTWVSDNVGEMRRYIETVLGEQALKGVS